MSAEQTKSRILEAAFREFAEYGVAGARVDRIAKSAACNKNLIYVYFGSKEALFASVLDRHLSEAYVGMPFTPEDLPGYARRVFDFAQANPGVYRLLAWATLERAAALPPAREREHDSTLPLIRAQQESGAIQGDPPPALILMAVMALATAWSPVFPFGATANPTADLSTDTIRDNIARMVARIVGRNAPDADAANAATPSGATGASVPEHAPGPQPSPR
jgi:AcrR family transcriptional regulator